LFWKRIYGDKLHTFFIGQMFFLSPDQQQKRTKETQHWPRPVAWPHPVSSTTILLKEGTLLPLCQLSHASTSNANWHVLPGIWRPYETKNVQKTYNCCGAHVTVS